MLDDLILFQKTYDYFVWVFPIVARFPKQQRFVIGQEIEHEGIALLRSIVALQHAQDKKDILISISDSLQMMHIYMRLAKDVRLTSIKHYAVSAEKLNELERICAGLKKKFS